MTKDEKIAISKAYILGRGFSPKRVSTLEPLLAALILDCARDIWDKEVKPHPWRFKAKQLEGQWRKRYHNFNRKLFGTFTEEQKDQVIDIMDEFEAYISNDVMIAKVQFWTLFSYLDSTQSHLCSAIFMCNILAQAAEQVYGGVFKNALGEDWTEPDIRGMREASYHLANEYHRGITDHNVNPNEFKPLADAVSVLCKKIYRFLMT